MKLRTILQWTVGLFALTACAHAAPTHQFCFSIQGEAFTAELTFTTAAVAGLPAGAERIVAVSGWFQNPDSGLMTIDASHPATVLPVGGLLGSGRAANDNLLFPQSPGNRILDGGGLMIALGAYKLQIFSDRASGYFYWADNARNLMGSRIQVRHPVAPSQTDGVGAPVVAESNPARRTETQQTPAAIRG